jgi:MFS family permease
VLALVTYIFFLSCFLFIIRQPPCTTALPILFPYTTLAASTILVAYMLGLGLGGVLGGRLADRLRRGIRVYGWIEVAIGVYALVVPFLLARLPAVSRAPALIPGGGDAAPPERVSAPLLLVLILPTILSGATRSRSSWRRSRPRDGAMAADGLLCRLNTLGAVMVSPCRRSCCSDALKRKTRRTRRFSTARQIC